MHLTENEIIALKTCLNYGTRADQLSDNYSNGGTAEFMAALGWNEQQVGGLISSLEKKGLAWKDDELGIDQVWLTELGVNTIFDLIEAESKVEGEQPLTIEQARDLMDLKATQIIAAFAQEVYGEQTRTTLVKAHRAIFDAPYYKARKFYEDFFATGEEEAEEAAA